MEILQALSSLKDTSVQKTQVKIEELQWEICIEQWDFILTPRIPTESLLGRKTSGKRKRRRSGRNNYKLKQKANSRGARKPQNVSSITSPMVELSKSPISNSIVPYQTSINPLQSAASEQDPQKDLQCFLNLHLIYFKVLEKKVQQCLSKSALKPSLKSLDDLTCLRIDLEDFLNVLERFYHEEHILMDEIEESFEFQEILKCTGKLQNILNKLDESEIPMLLKTTIQQNDEIILCSILGLRDEVAEFLTRLSLETRCHQTDEQWILDFIEDKNKDLTNYEDRESGFEFLGFTPIKSSFLADLVQQNPYADHQTTADWARDHIEQQFKYNILLAGHKQEGSTQPYNVHDLYDKHFDIPTNSQDDSFNVKARDTFMLNDKEIHQAPWLQDYITQEQKSLNGVKFWFHGTDHDSAKAIIRSGIDVTAAKRRRDFSDGKGFYLSTSYEMAHMWPSSRTKKTNTAVIIFKSSPEMFSKGGVEFEEDSKDWENLVTFFRKGKQGSIEQIKQYRKLKYIFGPMSGDGFKVKDPSWVPTAKVPHKFQLCIIDQDLADELYSGGKNIVEAIFFH